MTFDIGLHEVCVRTGVRYVITKFSGMDSLPNFLTHGASLRARAGAPLLINLFVAFYNLSLLSYLKLFIAGLPRALRARGTEPHTHTHTQVSTQQVF